MDTHVYRSLEEFYILDRVDKQILIGDWKKGQRRWLWVNKAWCESNRTTLEFWQNMDMNNAQSEAMEQFQDEIYVKVQVQREEVTRIKTVYHQGQARTLQQNFRPIQVQLPEWDEERTLFTNEVKSPEVAKDSGEQNKLAIAAELLSYSDIITMMFDAQNEELEYCNQKATTTFELARRQDGGRLNRLQTLNDVFSCILWEDDEQKKRITSGVRAFALNSPRIVVECQMHFSGLDDEEIWQQVSFISGMNPVSGKASVIVNLTDVSTLHKQSSQILEASRMQEQFFAAVSHELRTPLNGIIGLSESLISNPICNDQMRKTLRLVKSSGMRLASLVNDILDAASAKRGSFVIKRETVFLDEVADNVCELLRPTMPRQRVQLLNLVGRASESGAGALTHIEGDSGRVSQILTNLVSNAIKFTEKGAITLSARLISPNELLVEVADTGCGVAKDKWEQVWGAFQQVDMSTTRKYGGTGLGLSLVKELAEAHNGRVGIESVSSGSKTGSTFFFVLPVKQPTDSRGATSSRTAGSKLLRYRDLRAGVVTDLWEKGDDDVGSGDADAGDVQEVDGGGRSVGGAVSCASSEDSAEPRASRITRNVRMAEGVKAGGEQRSASAEPGQSRGRRTSGGEGEGLGEGGEKTGGARSRSVEVGRRVSGEYDGEGLGVGVGKVQHHSELYGTLEILSVDDHQVNHCVVENSVSPRGFVVTTCMSGFEALELLDTRGFLPDLILLDCMMPRMSGYEMCAKLREKYPCNTLPVIMVSAKSKEEDIVRGLAVGCNDYIAKPFGPSELNARIDVQLRLKELWMIELSRQLHERGEVLNPPLGLDFADDSGELRLHTACTVLVCDVVDMLAYAQTLSAPHLAQLVNALYDEFDAIANQHALTRIVDDSYMLVLEDDSMPPEAQARTMLSVAGQMLACAQAVKVAQTSPRVRIGIARGSADSGVVGMQVSSLLYLGPAVREAVQVVVRAAPGCVVVTDDVKEQLSHPLEALTPYVKMQNGGAGLVGSWMYVAKIGEHDAAMKEVAARSVAEPTKPVVETGAQSPIYHLRAFLRLSKAGKEDHQAAEEEEEDDDDCLACRELRSECQRLERELCCKQKHEMLDHDVLPGCTTVMSAGSEENPLTVSESALASTASSSDDGRLTSGENRERSTSPKEKDTVETMKRLVETAVRDSLGRDEPRRRAEGGGEDEDSGAGWQQLRFENAALLRMCSNLSDQLSAKAESYPRAHGPWQCGGSKSLPSPELTEFGGGSPLARRNQEAKEAIFRELQHHAWDRLSEELGQSSPLSASARPPPARATDLDPEPNPATGAVKTRGRAQHSSPSWGQSTGLPWARGPLMPLKNWHLTADEEDDFLAPPRSILCAQLQIEQEREDGFVLTVEDPGCARDRDSDSSSS